MKADEVGRCTTRPGEHDGLANDDICGSVDGESLRKDASNEGDQRSDSGEEDVHC